MGTMYKSHANFLLHCRAGLPIFHMESRKEQCTRRPLGPLRTNLGTSTWLQHTTLSWKHGPTQWCAHVRVFYRHQTADPCAYPALHEAHVHREAGKALDNGTWEWSIKWQLLLGGKKTLRKNLRQTLELEVIKLAVRSPIRLCKMSDRTLCRIQTPYPTPLLKWKKRLPTAYMPVL
jgi:hypothetical protein